MHDINVVVDDRYHTTDDSNERRRYTACLGQNWCEGVHLSWVLLSRIRDKEVHSQHQVILSVYLCYAPIQRHHFIFKVYFWCPCGTLNVLKETVVVLSWGEQPVLSHNFVVLDEIIVVSVRCSVQHKLRMKLIVSWDWPAPNVWFVTQFNAFFQCIGSKVEIIKKLVYVVDVSAVLFIITKYSLKGEWNPFLLIRVRILNPELFLDALNVRAKPLLNFVFGNLSVTSQLWEHVWGASNQVTPQYYRLCKLSSTKENFYVELDIFFKLYKVKMVVRKIIIELEYFWVFLLLQGCNIFESSTWHELWIYGW